MIDRRVFIRQLTAAGLLSSIPAYLFSKSEENAGPGENANSKIWASLIHVSPNWQKPYEPDGKFDETLWNDILKKIRDTGLNTIVMDLNDAIVYKSHPEIAVKNAWSVGKLKEELAKIREMGLEPIPKMNFSTGHDGWLLKYGRSKNPESNPYHDLYRDLIDEVSEIYNKPRFIHLGMDEEILYRRNKLEGLNELKYWADVYILIGEVFKTGARPWMWVDYNRYYPEQFARMMPKTVLLSNWYNCGVTRSSWEGFNKQGLDEEEGQRPVKSYVDLEKLGYDQVPGASNVYEGSEECFANTVRFALENIADERLFGFIQSAWKPTIEANRKPILQSIELAGKAKKWFEEKVK